MTTNIFEIFEHSSLFLFFAVQKSKKACRYNLFLPQQLTWQEI